MGGKCGERGSKWKNVLNVTKIGEKGLEYDKLDRKSALKHIMY